MLAKQIYRMQVRNYRSIEYVDVALDALTILVGPNGSGKSNLLDVLRFVSDALRTGLDAALLAHDRGGIGRLRRYSKKGRPFDVSVTLWLRLDGVEGSYSFTLASEKKNEFAVKNETCTLGLHEYVIENGVLTKSTLPNTVAIQGRNLTLPLVGNSPEFSPIYDFLSHMGLYSIFPTDLRSPQRPGNAYPLDEQGANLASVLREFIRATDNPAQKWLYQGLAAIVPGVNEDNPISVTQLGSYLVIRLNRADQGTFDLALESDGTLRALGLLSAIYQQPSLSLLGVEEPELMLHPGAMGVLCDILLDAATRSQIILTTHSPDLLNRFPAEALRLVDRSKGTTEIGMVGEGDRKAIEDQLFGSGDLLRIGGLARVQ